MDTVKSALNLWYAFRKGDSSAFAELYTNYYAELMPYALKICQDSDLAYDAIHNTFLYLWQNKERLGEVSSLKFYLLRSVRHECLSLLKKQKQFLQLEGEEFQPSIVILPEELQLKDGSKFAKHKIKEALQSLSDRQREIIYLKFYNNLDYEEISSLLSLNYQSVVNSIHRSMIKLRTQDILKYLQDL